MKAVLRTVGSGLATVVAVAALTGCSDEVDEPTADDAIAACRDELARAGIYDPEGVGESGVAVKGDAAPFYARRDGDDWTATGVIEARQPGYAGWFIHELVCPLTRDDDGWRLTAPITDNGTPRTD